MPGLKKKTAASCYDGCISQFEASHALGKTCSWPSSYLLKDMVSVKRANAKARCRFLEIKRTKSRRVKQQPESPSYCPSKGSVEESVQAWSHPFATSLISSLMFLALIYVSLVANMSRSLAMWLHVPFRIFFWQVYVFFSKQTAVFTCLTYDEWHR